MNWYSGSFLTISLRFLFFVFVKTNDVCVKCLTKIYFSSKRKLYFTHNLGMLRGIAGTLMCIRLINVNDFQAYGLSLLSDLTWQSLGACVETTVKPS